MASSGKIRGITIEIGGDTSGLQSSLKKVNDEISTTQRSLKDVEKLLKLDPTNTELLEQKQRLLNQSVGEYKEKLDALKSAQDQFAAAAASGDAKAQASYDALQREIVSTQEYLKDAEKEARNFNGTLEQAAGKLGKVSSAAQTVADKTRALSAAAGAAVAGIGAMAYKVVTASDDLNTLAKQTGLSTAEIQKFNYASDLIDVSLDDMTGALKKMKKNMDSNADTWEKLGVSTKNADGSFRDTTTVFYEVLQALSKVGNETERDLLAMDMFGKGADSLAGIIDDGGAALQSLGQDAENLGIILDQETLDSLNEVNDQIDTMKARAEGLLATTGAKAVEALMPVLDQIIDKVSALFEWIGSLDAEQLKLIITVAAVVAGISPIASLIAGITGAISGLMTIWPAIAGAGSAVLGFIAANPITLIAAAIAALAAIIYTHWDQIQPILANIKEKVLDLVDTIKDRVKTNINKILGFVNSAINAINKLITGVNALSAIVGLPQIPMLKNIPLLAKGGVVRSGSAIVGEAGAELLTVSGGAARVTPLSNTRGASGINVTVNNTFGGQYTSAQGQAVANDIVRQIDRALGKAY